VQSVVLPVIKKLSTDKLCLIPHVGTRTHVYGKMFRRRPREFPAWYGAAQRSGEKKKEKRKNYERVKGTRRMARARSAAPIENHAARGMFFPFSLSLSPSLLLSLSLSLSSSSFFFLFFSPCGRLLLFSFFALFFFSLFFPYELVKGQIDVLTRLANSHGG
jgi:hypothetical protein